MFPRPARYTICVKSLCLAIPLLALVGCAGPQVSPTDKALIAQADQLHDRLAPALVDRADPRIARYFEQIDGRILAAAKELDQQGAISSAGDGSNAWMFARDMEFHLARSGQPNTFASGGRHLYIYDGLFQLCRSEDELAALMCHEFGHIYRRHVQQTIKRDPALSGEDAILFPFATLRRSAGDDRSAEAVAFSIFCKAGWDPGQFATLWQRLLDEGDTASLDQNLLRQRVTQARRSADELPPTSREWAQPPVADEARFAQLQAEARRVIAGMPADERSSNLLAAFPSCLVNGETQAQVAARLKLFPPSPQPTNQWGKGVGR